MKQKTKPNWFEICSVFGAGLSVFFGFVNCGSGGILIRNGYGFNGAVTLVSAIGWFAVAVCLYLANNKKPENKDEKAEK